MNADPLIPGAGVEPSAAIARFDLVEESSFTAVTGSGGMRYRPLKQLGAGGMARVFLACGAGPSGFTKLVVLKVMRRELLADATSREMFLTEARLSARLNHPNLMQVSEVIQGAEVPYLVMEHLDGKPLSSIKLCAEFDQSMMLTVISEALVGLHHAHELRDFDGAPLSIVHRDISPHNVFVTYDGVVKVLDFGIAKAANSSAHTETGEIKGKLTYMAPEQLLGQQIDRRADIFSAGCMLWEAAVGARLWENVPAASLMHQLAIGDIPRPSARATVDAELERIIVKATAAEPDERYSTALELQRELELYLGQSGRRRALRDVGASLAQIYREEREEESRLIRNALRNGSTTEPEPTASKGDVAFELSVKQPSLRRNWVPVVGAVAAVLALALGVAGRLRKEPEPTPAHVVGSTTASPTVKIHVRATPPQATISIDGKEQGVGSIVVTVVAEARERSVQISSPGFATETRVLAFDRAQVLDVSLDKLPERPTSAAPPPSSARPLRGVVRMPARNQTSRASASASQKRCDPPYYFVNGIKTFKPECL